MEKHVWRIDVPGCNGYSFAIRCSATTESDAIELAGKNDLFQDEPDQNYCSAEEITDDEYEMNFWGNQATDIQ